MILIGRYLSPFVRRVGATLHHFGMEFEHRPIRAGGADQDEIRKSNPTGRVPVLILDDGEILADSAVIVDYLDYLAGPERALMPQSGWERYRMLSLLSISTAAAEKVVAAYMERSRPEENQHEPSIENAVRQAKDGFEYLNAAVVGPWMIGDKLTQLDISTVAYVEFVNHSVPEIKEAMHCPKLNAVIERALELPAYQKTPI